MGLYFLLIAGASANNIPAWGGALAFDVNSPPWEFWGGGSAFMLFAGAGVDSPLAFGGALTFAVNSVPSWAYWHNGSALFLLSIFICILYE